MRKKDDEKQRCIKNAVVQLILEEGFQGTSISKIAKAAGVSPATVYIYYENKDAMLRDIYQEYAEDTIQYLLQCLSPNMAGEEIIAKLIRRYYFFIVENKEVFHFIEQFSACPVLHSSCGSMKGPADLNQLLADLKKQQILNDFNNDNLYAILFSPVKMIAIKTCDSENTAMERLNELIYIIQKALIKDFKL
ncbi:TetR/AcrR family transcriptional regulator [Desulfitobacterium hafniense]|uniref:TetR/AcrR family transcriptional regulator n=1 Tax=Desulfitobacterium hafniense TaxID=49338 RepID=UPI0003629212|nr:TetR/AcrR family transcriptional regulator [Desulfitobacterium hafniense]